MANKARLLEVAAALRALPEDFVFDMNRVLYIQYGKYCGCIAGLTIMKYGEIPEMVLVGAAGRKYARDGSYTQAKSALGLDSDQTDALFFPQEPIVLNKVTAPIAADVVERFALTGEISWPEEVMGEDDES